MSTTAHPSSLAAPPQRLRERAARGGSFIIGARWQPARVLHCAAGFYRNADIAALIAATIRQQYRLSSQQVMVLAPADAAPLRFCQLARQWAQRRAADSADSFDPAGPRWGGAGLGALLDRGLAMLLSLLGRRRHFDQTVQARLAAGDWAVVVNRVPMSQQLDVVTGLRDTGHKWCADAPRLRRA